MPDSTERLTESGLEEFLKLAKDTEALMTVYRDLGARRATAEKAEAELRGPYWNGPKSDALQKEYRGLVDRQGGASVPARGSVLDAEISSIEANMADGDYLKDLNEQARYRTLLVARDADPPASALANGAANLGVDETGAAVAYGVVKQILDAMPDDVRGDIDASFEQLPEAVQVAIGREFAAYLPPVNDATPQQVEDFGTHEAGEMLIHEWADSAPLNVAIVKARWQAVRDNLDDNGRGWMDWYIDEALQPHEAAAVLRVLAT